MIIDGSETFDLSANASRIDIRSGQVTAAGRAIGLLDASATIANATVTSANDIGLLLARSLTAGSSATVTNSSITGSSSAVQATAGSTLVLVDSQLTSTAAGSVGLRLLGAQASATGSTITGQGSGVRMSRESALNPNAPTLTLNDTSVIGVTGPAIDVAANAAAVIDVLNGSTLQGGNGVMVNVSSGTSATVNVADSALVGNVVVADNSVANLNFNQASMRGDVLSDTAANTTLTLNNSSQLTGKLENVQQVNITSSSDWTMTADSTIGNLAMSSGQVTMGDTGSFYRLNTTNLSGNGNFVMGTDFVTGNTDFINVTGTSSGSHGLLVRSSGSEAALDSVQVVHTADGGAQFRLLNQGGLVDAGAYSYELMQKGTDWYLDNSKKIESPATQTVKAMFNTGATVSYGELASLRTRMGELRYTGGKSQGVWARTYANQHNITGNDSGAGYKQRQTGFSVGADTSIADGWLVGLMAGTSSSDLSLSHGSSGDIDSYYVGGYSTWIDPKDGYYIDTVVKLNRYDNDAKVGLSDGTSTKGDYRTHGVTASVEAGKHIKLEDNYFVEPFAQVATTFIRGKDFTLDNGLRAEGDDSRSLLGKVGATAGRNIALDGGRMIQPYVKAALVHEFAQKDKVQVNGNSFRNDLSGSRGEFGVGAVVSFSESFQVHADFDYMHGENIEKPYGVSLGARYSF